MTPDKAVEICKGLGWPTTGLVKNQQALEQLCRRRHQVAHGDTGLISQSRTFYKSFQADATIIEQLLYDWAIYALEPVNLTRFLTPTP